MSREKISQKVVAPVDGPEHGYHGVVQDDTPNEAYTVTGVTKDTDAAAGDTEQDGEQPKPVSRASRPKHASS